MGTVTHHVFVTNWFASQDVNQFGFGADLWPLSEKYVDCRHRHFAENAGESQAQDQTHAGTQYSFIFDGYRKSGFS